MDRLVVGFMYTWLFLVIIMLFSAIPLVLHYEEKLSWVKSYGYFSLSVIAISTIFYVLGYLEEKFNE